MDKLLDPGAWLDRLTRRVAFIGLVGLLAVAIATMVDVLLRWLFNSPIEGYEDVSQLLFAVIIAACFPAGLIQGRNITIRFLGKGPRAARDALAGGAGRDRDVRVFRRGRLAGRRFRAGRDGQQPLHPDA